MWGHHYGYGIGAYFFGAFVAIGILLIAAVWITVAVVAVRFLLTATRVATRYLVLNPAPPATPDDGDSAEPAPSVTPEAPAAPPATTPRRRSPKAES